MNKLPMYIKYIEKEYGICILEQTKKKEKTIDIIRQKYGKDAIIKGAIINSDIGIYLAPDKKS